MSMRPTEHMLISQALAPVSSASGAANGAAIDTTDYEGVTFILEVGVMTATGTLDMKIQRASASAFGSPVDVVGAALAQILAATGGSKVYIIDVRNPIMQYLRCVVTPATAASVFGVTAIGYGKRGTRPAAAAATQTVTVIGV